MKKRLVALVLYLMLLLSACSVSNDPVSSDTETGSVPGNVSSEPEYIGNTLKYDVNAPVNNGEKIDLLIWAEPETEGYYGTIAEKYMNVHPNVSISVVSQPWDDYWTKLPLALSAGKGPDLYRSHYGHIKELALYSHSLPEDVFPREELFADFPDAEDLIMDDGGLYSIPLGATFSGGIYYNKTMWEEAGLTENDIPKTWDDFIRVGQALTKKDDKGNITQYGFSIDHAFQVFLVNMNYMSGQALVQEDNFTWNLDAPKTYENIELLRKFKDEYGFMMFGDGDCEDQFGHGQAAMMSNWNWVGGYFNETYPDVDWGYFHCPTPDGKTAPAYGLKDYEWSLGVSAADEKKREVAFDFLKFFLCEQNVYCDVAIRLGLMPSNVHLANDPRVADFENIRIAAEVADRYVYLGAIPGNAPRNQALRAAGSDIFINKKDPKEVIPTTQKNIMEDMALNQMTYVAKENQYKYYSELSQ